MTGDAHRIRSGVLTLMGASLFLSGMAGLIYQVVWTRRLSLVTGSSSQALAATLAAFMGGMALGGWLLGRTGDRKGARPFRINATLQIGVLAGAAATPTLQALLVPLLSGLYGSWGPGPLLTLARFASSVAILGVPAVLMGATLPVAVRGVATDLGVGKGVASMYSLNTLGGIAGAVTSGFLLIPRFGMAFTLRAGLLLSAAAALLSWLAPCSAVPAGTVHREGACSEKDGGRKWLAAGFLAGAAMLASEVLWARALVRGAFNNAYATSTMLAAVLCGIAAGSASSACISTDRERAAARALAFLALWIPLSGLLLRVGLPLLEPRGASGSLEAAMAARYVPAFLLVLPAGFASGAAFPLMSSLHAPEPRKSASGIGRYSAANTAGAVAGSLLAAFVLLPAAGLRWSFAASGLLASSALAVTTPRGFPGRAAFAAALAAAGFAVTIAGGPGIEVPPGCRLLGHAESPDGDVTVLQSRDMPSALVISIGGSQASTTTPEGSLKNRLMAYFPMLVHPSPRSVCVICFGTGITAGTASLFPSVERLDCVEINPAVIEASGPFEAQNHGVISGGRAGLVIEDGRNHLAGTTTVYDVITEEPMHPALSGVVNLYTREYYRLARDRLSSGGVMSQWLPLYQMSDADCRMVVATFLDVFPEATMWLLGRDAVLVGRKDLPVEPLQVAGHLADGAVAADLEPFGLDEPGVFLSLYAMGPMELADYARGAPVVTDDRPILESSAPRAVFGPSTVAQNISRILDLRVQPAGAESLCGQGFLDAWEAVGLFQEAECARDSLLLSKEAELMSQAFERCPDFLLAGRRLAASLHQGAAVMLERERPEEAWMLVNAACATGLADAALLADLSSMETSLGMYGPALEHAEQALEAEPSSAAALRAWGMAALCTGDRESARKALALADSLSRD